MNSNLYHAFLDTHTLHTLFSNPRKCETYLLTLFSRTFIQAKELFLVFQTVHSVEITEIYSHSFMTKVS